ncbi:hypothetical protein [Parvimonas micra]
MKKNIPYFTILISFLIWIGRISYTFYSKESISFEQIFFLPSILGIVGFFFCKYSKNPKVLKFLNIALIPLNIVAFTILLEIID